MIIFLGNLILHLYHMSQSLSPKTILEEDADRRHYGCAWSMDVDRWQFCVQALTILISLRTMIFESKLSTVRTRLGDCSTNVPKFRSAFCGCIHVQTRVRCNMRLTRKIVASNLIPIRSNSVALMPRYRTKNDFIAKCGSRI